MKHWMLAVAVAGAVACNSKNSESVAKTEDGAGAKTFTVTVVGGAGSVKVSAAIPSTWTTDVSDPDMPTFKIRNLERSDLAIVANSIGRDPARRVAKAIDMQFGSIPDAKREDLPDGRVWMVGTLGENAVARLYVPFDGGVVMGGATIPKGAGDRLPEIRKVFETITINVVK
jgi:hypothetical protein